MTIVKVQQGILLAGAVALGVLAWRSTRDTNEFEDHSVALDSKEAKVALAVLKQLAQSTNHIEACLSPKANPMVRRQVLQRAIQMRQAKEIKLKKAAWRRSYLSVDVACPAAKDPGATLHFYLVKNDQGELKLIGAP